MLGPRYKFHRMGATYCLVLSRMPSILLAVVASVGVVSSQEDSVIPTIASQKPQIYTRINPQQKPSKNEYPALPHAPEDLDDRDKSGTINGDIEETTVHLVALELEHIIHNYTEVMIEEFNETVWSNNQAHPTRLRREATDFTGMTQRDSHIIENVTLPSASTANDPFASTPAQEPPSELSIFHKMYLCDHPPKTFSPEFHGSLWESCLQYERMWPTSFRNTMMLCNVVYALTEAKTLKYGHYQSHIGLLKVITNEAYVNFCLPLFRSFNKCEERDFLTICWEDRVAFFHSSICPHSSNDIFLASFLLDNNTVCFQEFCQGWQNVMDGKIGSLHYRLTNALPASGVPSCGYMTKSLKHIKRKYNGTLYLFLNTHWPCCYSYYTVIWAGLPEAHGLNGAWSYMPVACQAGEVLLVVMVGCVMVGSIGGNLLVLVIMFRGGHRRQESSMLRTSLAFSDMLTAAFVIVPSFVNHLWPFLFPPTYIKLEPNMKLAHDLTELINSTWKTYTTHSFRTPSGFTIFQSVLFHITSTASLLMLLVLSVERFVITGRYLRYKDYFSYGRTVLAITFSWITSLANALWFAAHDDGRLSAQWLTFEKLPTGASWHGQGGVRLIIYHGQVVIFFTLGISVVTFSALAIRNFVKEQLHVAKEWRRLKMKASKQYSKDNRYVLTTMILMLILFLTSTIPLITNIVLNSLLYRFHHHLFSHFAWWLFMANSAWNPWVYNFRSRQFKEDLINFRKILQMRRQQQFRPKEPQPLPSTGFPSANTSLPTESRTE
uniref:G-protein coupled receptors family 1 profile domain-containing protein n=1 Tax=Scylla olivacea TaxID=85551 RepID=A0A0P4WAH6_SCYOL